MKSRTLIAAAVAGACAWPMFAAAKGATTSGGSLSSSVSTSSSVDEGASVTAGPVFVETITPHSVSESAPWMTAEETRARHTRVQSPSLPNPQTPWSVSESGPNDYAQDMRERAQQVAAVEQQRVAVARIESERLAAIERERLAALEQQRLENLERERLATIGTPESATAVSAAPMQADTTGSSAAPVAGNTPDLPITPGETPAQPDRSAGLVDRNAGTMSLAPAPHIGTSNEPGADAAAADVGVTRSEGPSVSGIGPQPDGVNAATSQPAAVPMPDSRVESESTAAPIAAAGAAEPTRVNRDNAYVPVIEGQRATPAQ